MIDLAAARETFEASTDLTVGIEEEFALLDPETLELVPRVRGAARRRPQGRRARRLDRRRADLQRDRDPLRAAAPTSHDALARQAEARRRLFKLADAHGVTLGSTGTHPLSDYQAQHLIDTEHYRRVGEGLKYVAWRNNTFSVHVHVGVRGADRAVRVCDRLRPILPTLLAISANSPFVDRIDSGLHTARTQIFTKSFPRCGDPGRLRHLARRGRTTSTCCSARARSSSSRSCGGPCARTTTSARSRSASATPRRPPRESDALVAADRRLRRPGGCARSTRAGRSPDVPGPADRGEHVAGDPPRARRAPARPRARRGRVEEYPAAEAVERLSAWAGVDRRPARSSTAPSASGGCSTPGATPAEVYAESVKETTATYQEAVEK